MSVNRLDRWIGRDRLCPDEIDANRFLKAASLFADTAIQYGRDRYSGKDMPLFADCLHTDHLKDTQIYDVSPHRHRAETSGLEFLSKSAEPDAVAGFFKPVHWEWHIHPCCRRGRRIHVQQLLVSRKWRSALGWAWLCGLSNR